MDTKLREAERLASTGDPADLARLIHLRRRLFPTGYDITKPIHRFLINCANGRADHYTGFHNEKGFRVRFCYRGDLVFQYQDGIIVIAGGYQTSDAWWRLLREAFVLSTCAIFGSVYQALIPEDMQYSVRCYNGDTDVIVIKLDDPDSFQGMKDIIDVWLAPIGAQ